MKVMNQFRIYWNDLTSECKEALLLFLGDIPADDKPVAVIMRDGFEA